MVPMPDARHDVFLSLPEPRRRAYETVDRWLDGARAGSAGVSLDD